MFARLERQIPGIEKVPTLIGETVFTVPVDESPILTDLQAKARELRGAPFEESERKLIGLTLDALGKNAVELAAIDPEARDLVYAQHSLSEVLVSRKACCRYQALLFFMLAREARLGVSHSLLTQRMNGPYSVYNLIFDEADRGHTLSLYNMSLSSDEARKKYGYPKPTGDLIPGWDISEAQEYYAYVASTESADQDPLLIKTKGNSRAMRQWNTDISRLIK